MRFSLSDIQLQICRCLIQKPNQMLYDIRHSIGNPEYRIIWADFKKLIRWEIILITGREKAKTSKAGLVHTYSINPRYINDVKELVM